MDDTQSREYTLIHSTVACSTSVRYFATVQGCDGGQRANKDDNDATTVWAEIPVKPMGWLRQSDHRYSIISMVRSHLPS